MRVSGLQSVTGVDSARNAGMDVVVVAANVNEHLDKGSPGILERVPEFSGLCVPTLISRRTPVNGRAVARNGHANGHTNIGI